MKKQPQSSILVHSCISQNSFKTLLSEHKLQWFLWIWVQHKHPAPLMQLVSKGISACRPARLSLSETRQPPTQVQAYSYPVRWHSMSRCLKIIFMDHEGSHHWPRPKSYYRPIIGWSPIAWSCVSLLQKSFLVKQLKLKVFFSYRFVRNALCFFLFHLTDKTTAEPSIMTTRGQTDAMNQEVLSTAESFSDQTS